MYIYGHFVCVLFYFVSTFGDMLLIFWSFFFHFDHLMFLCGYFASEFCHFCVFSCHLMSVFLFSFVCVFKSFSVCFWSFCLSFWRFCVFLVIWCLFLVVLYLLFSHFVCFCCFVCCFVSVFCHIVSVFASLLGRFMSLFVSLSDHFMSLCGHFDSFSWSLSNKKYERHVRRPVCPVPSRPNQSMRLWGSLILQTGNWV